MLLNIGIYATLRRSLQLSGTFSCSLGDCSFKSQNVAAKIGQLLPDSEYRFYTRLGRRNNDNSNVFRNIKGL